MESAYRPNYTKPLPDGAELLTRKGERSLRLAMADKLAAYFRLRLQK